jgi:protein-tyrosine-phosphatase
VYILFVCSGNTCRSVMAKYLLLSKIPPALRKCLTVESAGVSVTESRSPASERAIEALSEWGIDASAHRAQKLTEEMVSDADLILTMTREQLARIEEMTEEEDGRAYLFSEFVYNLREMDLCKGTYRVEGWWGQGEEITDPYNGDRQAYRQARDKIDALVRILVEKIETKNID